MKNIELVSVNSDDENDHQSYNLRVILNRYLYHWPIFLVGIILCLLAGNFYLQKANPAYTINASVIIKDNKKDPDNKNDLQQLSMSGASKLVENEIEVLSARNLIYKVVNDLGLWITYKGEVGGKSVDLYQKNPVRFVLLPDSIDMDKITLKIKIKNTSSFYLENKDGSVQEFLFNQILYSNFGAWKLIPTAKLMQYVKKEIKINVNDRNRITEEYQKNIKIEMPNKQASTISLSLKDEVDQRGKDILNALIDDYNETSIGEKNRITKRTLDFIDERIRSLSGDLNSSEQNIEGYRSRRGITDISSQSKVYLENVQANDSKLNEVNIQLNVLDGIDKYLNSNQNTLNVPSTLGISEPVLNNSIQKLSQLQLERQKLLATTPETNPDFESINRQIKLTKNTIEENITNIKSSLLMTKNKLESFNSKYESSIRNVPSQERQLVDKTRQQSIKENLYVYLLQKREEVALNYSSIFPDAQIVDYAYSDTKKSRRPIVFGIAFLLGIVLPAAFIYSRNLVTNRVSTELEIHEQTGLPVFCEIAYSNVPMALATPEKGDVVLSEDFRKLRTNLNRLRGKVTTGWITLVTSSIPNEGKSFISANLGYFLASSGKKIIVLEMDWRRPKLLRIFGLSESERGITDFICNDISVKSLIRKSNVHPDLDVIGCGEVSANPSELIENDKVAILLNELRDLYDYVIIDTPPVNLVTDARILAEFSDNIFYVIRQGYTHKPLLQFIKSLSKVDDFANMKIVFNGIRRGRFGYGYNYANHYYQSINGAKKRNLKYLFSDFLKRF